MVHQLNVNNLGKRFDNYWVFQNLNYRFESGKIYALTGPSGGGKTTLLNCIGRLTDASDGEVMLDNKDELLYGEEGGGTAGAMKTLVYRVRGMLEELGAQQKTKIKSR